MALTTKEKSDIRKRYKTHRLEVSHLTNIAARSDPSDAECLEQLAQELGWQQLEPGFTPWDQWTTIVCEYIRGGGKRMVQLATQLETFRVQFYFAIAVLQDIRTKESAAALCKIAEAIDGLPMHQIHRPVGQVAHGIRLVLLPKGAPSISASLERRIRKFAHSQVERFINDNELSDVISVLGCVGNSSSITLLKTIDDLPFPWHDMRADTIREIKKRQS